MVRVHCTILSVACLSLVSMSLLSAPAWALGVGSAALVDPGLAGPGDVSSRVDPLTHGGYTLFGQPFSLYTGPGLLAEGYSLEASRSETFLSGSGLLAGRLDSEVWREVATDTLLFRYRLANTGQSGMASVHTVNVTGYASHRVISDSGVMETALPNPLVLQRYAGLLAMDFEGLAFTPLWEEITVEDLLEPGDETDWVYVNTDAQTWTDAVASVQNSFSSVGDVPTLAPDLLAPEIPEPLTVLTTGLATAGLAVVRLRRNQE